MPFFKKFSPIFAIISILFTAHSASGETLKPARNPKVKPPSVQILEGPHFALKTWQEKKIKGKTVIFLGSGLGIFPFNDEYAASVLKDMREGKWDDLLEKSYPTSKFYPVGPSTYLYLAWKAGMVGKVYWVPPTKDPVGKDTADPVSLFKSLGFDERGIKNAKKSEKSIESELNGVPVTICNLKDIPKIKDDCILIIDLSFFPPFYQNEVKTPFLDWFGGFMETLGKRPIKFSSVIISNSTGNGEVPLSFRFIGGYLKTYFREPGKLKLGPLPEWQLRSTAMYYNTFYQVEEEFYNYMEAVKRAPKDASLHYDLSRAYLNMKDLFGIRHHLDKAVALDKGYYVHYVEMGIYFTDKGMHEDAEVFLKKAEKICPDDPRIYEAFHKLYLAWKKFPESARALKKEISMGFENPDTYGALAESLRETGEYEQARENYNKALSYIPQVDVKARASLLLGLADTYVSEKKLEEAVRTYDEALRGMPEGHEKHQIIEKVENLIIQWEPFLNPPR